MTMAARLLSPSDQRWPRKICDLLSVIIAILRLLSPRGYLVTAARCSPASFPSSPIYGQRRR
ncbi:hypothetical protein TIFTF001_007794 [Ficus carica]|uniref:Uncharacterized protein n=1 Tax=Ficus carica TaxID=3494 RepID=A0AA88A3M2_FICCA|nr:hypothetical protein TIFTF001_007794 [Ficus carica]